VANHSPHEIDIHFEIAPEYYMYQERFQFELSAPGATLGEPEYPPAVVVYDPTFEKNMAVYREQVTIRLPIAFDGQAAGVQLLPLELAITSQGCADAGLCYAPITETVPLKAVSDGFEVQGQWAVDSVPAPLTGAVESSSEAQASERQVGVLSAVSYGDTGLAQFFSEAGWLEVVALAFILGLLLSFTPCVLPMVPILLSIIAGQGQEGAALTRRRGLAMAAAYVFGVSIVYTLLGVIAGMVGASLSIWLQTPWVLISFAIILAVLALSMFDVYSLQVPAGMQSRLQGRLGRLPAGRYGGVFLMGMLSALIVGPCIAAPLAGVLLFISQTGDLLLGGVTLFALAWGSGTLLLVVGATSSSFMPKAGSWMNLVKYGFGVLLLATAWWMLSLTALLPAWLWVLGWAVFALWLAFLLGLSRPLTTDSGPFSYLAKTLGWVLAVWAVLLLVSVGSGQDSVLRPIAGLVSTHQGAAPAQEVHFERISSEAELDEALAQTDKPVMLDFYADWCVSCIEMERFTFTDSTVAQLMGHMLLLQVDVTDNTPADRDLLKRFNLFGPPGIIFFNAQGQQLAEPRVVGFKSADQFGQELEKVLNDPNGGLLQQ